MDKKSLQKSTEVTVDSSETNNSSNQDKGDTLNLELKVSEKQYLKTYEKLLNELEKEK